MTWPPHQMTWHASKQVTSPPWNSRRLVHSKEMVWASRWSVALRTFYRQILSLLYSSFFFWNFRPRLARELLVWINIIAIFFANVFSTHSHMLYIYNVHLWNIYICILLTSVCIYACFVKRICRSRSQFLSCLRCMGCCRACLPQGAVGSSSTEVDSPVTRWMDFAKPRIWRNDEARINVCPYKGSFLESPESPI